jgi:plastocyanin
VLLLLIALAVLVTTTTPGRSLRTPGNPQVVALVATRATAQFVPMLTRTSTGVRIVEPDANNPHSWGYDPASITVSTGGTVVWTNVGKNSHSVVSDTGSPEAYSSANMATSQTFQHTFAQPGTYHYHCRQHPWMKGTVTVR